MKLLDLCAGIGGFSLAAHWLGWMTEAFCERDAFCQKVLKKNFPGIPIYDGVFTFPSESFRGRIDCISAGFPCQPFSQAGKRKGVNDERHLFPEIIRIVRSVQPAWIVLENVAGLISMALETRDVKVARTQYSRSPEIDHYEAIYAREETMLLNHILEEIECSGYAVQPVVVPAVALEADHERKRLWIVAHRTNTRTVGREREQADDARLRESGINFSRGRERPNGGDANDANRRGSHRSVGQDAPVTSGDGQNNGLPENANCDAPHTDNGKRSGVYIGLEAKHARTSSDGCDVTDAFIGFGQPSGPRKNNRRMAVKDQSAVSDVSDAQGVGLQRSVGPNGSERPQSAIELMHGCGREFTGRHENWPEVAARLCRMDARVSNRVDRLKSLGNSIVPQIAYEIFRAIENAEKG